MAENKTHARPLVIQVAAEREKEGRPRSIQVYAEAIRTRLEARGVRLIDVPFEDPDMLSEADIVWAPGLGNRRVPRSLFAAGPRGVATVHGLQFLGNGLEISVLGLRKGLGNYLWRHRIRADWSRLGPSIGAAISISNILKPQINNLLQVPSKRIEVIPHGIARSFFRPALGAVMPSSAGDYILHVSQYSRVKNLPGILAAYDRVRDRIGLSLRIVSGGWPGNPTDLPADVQMTTELVPHDQVRDLMWGARIFLFPSFEESFGMPALEAMASGVPVVTSLGTGAAEVVGDTGFCVDPTDPDAIAAALLTLATNPALHDRLARASYERAQGFDWDVAAEQHLALFNRLAGRDADSKTLTRSGE